MHKDTFKKTLLSDPVTYFNKDELKTHLPKTFTRHITDDLVRTLNRMIASPEFGENYSRNVITYTTVLNGGKYRLVDYFNAVAFVSHIALGCTSKVAYAKVYPDRYKRLVAKYSNKPKQVSAAVSAYKKSKLVVSLLEQMVVPDYLLFASARYKAIRKLVDLVGSDNPSIAHKASDSLLKHLKPPASQDAETNLPLVESNVMKDLSSALNLLALNQEKSIIEGKFSASDIAEAPLKYSTETD